MDFQMMCETIVRTIFQCGRFEDPLGRLANTDSWDGLHSADFSEEHKCKAWAVISRLQNEYLDSISGREDLYNQSNRIEEMILNATTNQEIIDAMNEINEIVNLLNLSEFPHINYLNTNDE
jgi:hypothetical protein